MRVSDALVSSVVFLGVEDDTPGKGGIHCSGTGFLLAYQDVGYLVTAKHVAKDLNNSPFRIRINKKDGTSGNLDADYIEWHYHSDPDVDVAAILFHMPGGYGYDCIYIPESAMFDAVLKKGHEAGIGDLCYAVGLFRVLAGQRRNLPVVHSGNLASIPTSGEKIPVLDWDDPSGKRTRHVEGYLVEMQTLSGLSGSPVFLRPSFDVIARKKDGSEEGTRAASNSIFLLGVWQASWDAPASEILAIERGHPITVPVGMGVVVPSARIMELLEMPKLKAQREEARSANQHPASLDSAPHPEPNLDENPVHREDFNRLVSAASKPKPKDVRT